MDPVYGCYKFDMAHRSESPTPPSMPSGRKGSKKVRTGCITCKIRKVKCDETKPYCLRCTKTGRKCDGYLDPRALASRRRSKETDGTPHTSLSLLLEWSSPDEKRALHFFQQVTAPSLSGDLDAVFWRVLVLQICQTEPAVRHAVLAVSGLHEGLTQGYVTPFADGGTQQSFALQQYNKAIACLLDQMNDPARKPMGPLLTCVLFVCIEFMQSKDKESLIHLEQGRQILSQLERRADSRDPEIDIIKQHLVPIYTRLSMTSFLFGGTPVPIPPSLKTVRDIPDAFESIRELRFTLYDLLDEVLRFAQRARPAKFRPSIPPEPRACFEADQRHLTKKLAKLNVAFSLYQASKPKEFSEATFAVLQMYLLLAKIWLATALGMSEAAYDDHVGAFSAIVPLAATILQADLSPAPQGHAYRGQSPSRNSTPPRDGRQHGTSIFTFETHIIPVLYFVATKCRHPLVRHSALDLLRRNPAKRENLWRADIMGAIAAHVVEMEERWALRPHSPSSGQGWNADVAGLPVPEDFLASVLAKSTNPRVPEIDLYGMASSAPQSNAATAAILAPEDMDMDLGMPIDPALLIDPDIISHHSFGGAASFTSGDDHGLVQDPSSMLLDPTSITVKYASAGSPALSASNAFSASQTCVSSPRLRPSPSARSELSSSSDHSHGLLPSFLRQSTEAPFDLPEHLRIHEAIIGPEKEDGSWVTVFRKLNGLGEEWDVQTEFVSAY